MLYTKPLNLKCKYKIKDVALLVIIKNKIAVTKEAIFQPQDCCISWHTKMFSCHRVPTLKLLFRFAAHKTNSLRLYRGSVDTDRNPHRPNTGIYQTKQKQIDETQTRNPSLLLPAPRLPAADPRVWLRPGWGAEDPSGFHLCLQAGPGWSGCQGARGRARCLGWPRSAPSEP